MKSCDRPIGFNDTLQNFLSRYFPGIQIFKAFNTQSYEVWLPENPAVKIAEEAADRAWEKGNI